MYILGYNCYVFDSAACLIKDGVIIAAAQEERFTREKGTGKFPKEAIEFCLKEAQITLSDVDHVAFYWQPLAGLFSRGIQILKNLPKSLNFWSSHSSSWLLMYNAQTELRKNFTPPQGEKPLRFKFHNVKHHLAHAAGSFLISPYKEAAILTMDGSGEITATSTGIGKENEINLINEISFPHSLGYLYVSLTHYLGFVPDSDEYKVMALASQGKESEYYQIFKRIISLEKGGRYKFDLSYFNYQKGIRDPWVSEKFIAEFGEKRLASEELSQRFKNIAWALQKRLEDVVIHLANHLYEQTNTPNLVIGGGCGLNCVMNEKILLNTKFENVWVPPAPNDAGTSIGAAYWVHSHVLGKQREFTLKTAYLGRSFSNQQIEEVLKSNQIEAEFLPDEELIKKVAHALSSGKIIGWFQGKSEFGPRALGSRSILADPRSAEMKDKLNLKIKHRESFRPFAPVVLEDKASEYFENIRSLPFMTFVLSIKKSKIQDIPAVSHTDGTARVQTINKDQNQKLYRLIHEFSNITNTPVLLNTSLNDSGEPIVDDPLDALKTFKSTGLDYLVLENYLITADQLA